MKKRADQMSNYAILLHYNNLCAIGDSMKRIIALSLLAVLCAPTAFALADDDTYVKIQEMVNDLGGPALQKKNNGKVQACADKGTKKITITKKDGGTTYRAVYKNCIEYGRQRSGNTMISTN
jgi:hypothetical protein